MKNIKMFGFISIISILVGISLISYGVVSYSTNTSKEERENSNVNNNEPPTEDNKEENTTPDVKPVVINLIGEEIDINDTRVTEAYDKILKTYDLTDTIYKKQKQTYETLSDKTIMETISKQINDISVFEIEKIGQYHEGNYIYKLNETVIKDYMKKIFGDVFFDYDKYNKENGLLNPNDDHGGPIMVYIKNKIVDENNHTLPGDGTLYCKEFQNGMYYFREFRAGGTTSEILYNNILKASIDNEYLHIYEEEFKVKYKDKKYVVYLDDETIDESIDLTLKDGELFLTTPKEEIRTLVGNKINVYNHTFKKDESGNYYWVSTEQLKR